MTDTSHQHNLAAQAAAQFPIKQPRITFIRHNENLTYRVADGVTGANYLLRIHRPSSPAFHRDPLASATLRSELMWLMALADAGFHVQRPLHALSGDMVGSVDGAWCTVLSWIEGATMQAPTAEDMRNLGELLARMRLFADKWVPPQQFTRARYDGAFFMGVAHKLANSVDLGILTAEQYETLLQAASVASTVIDREQTAGRWGLTHADINPGNLICTPTGICPIDFSLSGHCAYLWDLGHGLVNFPADLRQAALDTYNSHVALPDNVVRTLEACAVLGILCCFGFHLPNPSQHEWLSRRMPRSVQREWLPLLREEGFFFAI